MKNLLVNNDENRAHKRLIAVSSTEEAYVCPKVALKEIFEYDRLPKELRSHRDYCWKAHFDFLIVSSDSKPLFAVEFDGPLHRTDQVTQARDEKKDRLCEHFGLPILRIKSNYLNAKYRGFDLLTWFVACYFSQKDFYSAQAQGYLPEDEDFAPWNVIKSHQTEQIWPFWLSRDITRKFHRRLQDGVCATLPSRAHWVDRRGNRCIVAWIKLNSSHGIIVQSAMRAQIFPISESDALDEIIIYELDEEFERVQSGTKKAHSIEVIEKRLRSIATQNQIDSLADLLMNCWVFSSPAPKAQA